MNTDMLSSARRSILAAGGIVLSSGKNSSKICVVRRRRYPGEVGLPKGKLRNGESLIHAARREVSEETGCNVHVQEFAGTTHYLVGGIPKAVFYFIMKVEGKDNCEPKDTKEIEGVEWLTPSDALLALTHREDRILISGLFGIRRSDQQ